MTPEIDCPRKTSPTVRVLTHNYGVSKEIDGKTFILKSKPRHVTPQIDHLANTSPGLRVSTHIYGVSTKIDWENMYVESKPRHVTPQTDHLRKLSSVLSDSTHINGVSKKIDGKMFMFNCHHIVIDHLYKYVHFTVYHIFLRYSSACCRNMFLLRKWLFHVLQLPKSLIVSFQGC